MSHHPNDVDRTVSHETVRSVSKLALGVIAILFLLGIVRLLPGIERIIPGTDLSLLALLGAAVSLALAGLLVHAAPGFATLIRGFIDASPDLGAHIASVGYWLVMLFAVLVVHRGVRPATNGVLGGVGWRYDLVFLVVSLVPVTIIAARLHASLDPAAEEISRTVGSKSQ